MAKSFYYPVNELASATLDDGTFLSAAFTNASALTNELRAVDQSIGTAVSGWTQNDGFRIDLGAAVACDFLAIYFNAIETTDLILYASDNSDNSSTTTAKTITASFVKGWNVFDFSSTNKRYWFLRQTGTGTTDNFMEFIIGNKYDFDVNFDLNNTESDISGSDVITSYGGNEFSNKRHSQKATWSWSWSNISSAMKTSLDTMKTAVEINRLKFVYYDETNYHYVRMSGLDFTEVAFQRYSTSMSLTEQLQ